MKTRKKPVKRVPRGNAPPKMPRRSGPLIPAAAAESRRIALLAAEAALDKKALGVQIVDVTGRVDYADFLVLMSGQSDRHVAAIARGVEEHLLRAGHRAISVEGLPAAQWVLLDFFDVVVHVFHQESRTLYDLDGLWMDAQRVAVPERAPDAP